MEYKTDNRGYFDLCPQFLFRVRRVDKSDPINVPISFILNLQWFYKENIKSLESIFHYSGLERTSQIRDINCIIFSSNDVCSWKLKRFD